MNQLYNIYYDNTIGFKILNIEGDFEYSYIEDLHLKISDIYYNECPVDYYSNEVSGMVGLISVPDANREPVIHLHMGR